MTDLYERIVSAEDPTGLYESNYLKANAPDGSGAFWIKHNVLGPQAGMPAAAEFWLVVWSDDWTPRVFKRVLALDQVQLASGRLAVRSDLANLEPDRAWGDFGEGVSWDLSIRHELPAFRHFAPDWMYTASFPRKKVVTGSPRAVFDGTIETPDGDLDVTGWVGHRNHNWGTEHALRYAYGGCCLWPDGPEDLTVEGFTVQVRLVGPVTSPWLTMVGGLDGDDPYGARTTPAALRSTGRVDWPRWVASSPLDDGDRVRITMTLDPEHTAGLRYLHPDGELSYCYNAKDADVTLHLGDRQHHSPFGELEFLFPDPVPGVPLHGHDSLEALRTDLDR